MEHFEFRALKIEDYDEVVRLWRRAGLPFKPEGRESKRIMEKQMKAFPEFFIGAFHGRKLVGVVVGSYDGRMKGWINRLAVDPECRRLGIAEQLVTNIEKALAKHGAAIFSALIELPNEESTSLFGKMEYAFHPDILYVSKRKTQEV